MIDIVKIEFVELTVSGKNYLTWAFDIKIILSRISLNAFMILVFGHELLASVKSVFKS
jgi:uncharacterized membrane protein